MHGVPTRPGRVLEGLGLARGEPTLRIPRLALVLAVVRSASGLVLGAVAVAASATGRPVADFTREPVAALQETTCAGAECGYIGFLSNAGLLLWAATASVCLLVAYLVRVHRTESGSRRRSSPSAS
jgi:hypothetical protein